MDKKVMSVPNLDLVDPMNQAPIFTAWLTEVTSGLNQTNNQSHEISKQTMSYGTQYHM